MLGGLTATWVLSGAALGQTDPAAQPDAPKRFTVQADLRFRFEADWDSVREDGTMRTDRERMRLRGRLGFSFQPLSWLTLAVRARTGPRDGQQSPHYTFYDFEDNGPGSFEGLVDRYYVRLGSEKRHVLVGRNDMPFWKQNEFLWDGTLTPAGVSATYGFDLPQGSLVVNAAVLTMLDGAVRFHGRLAAGQAVWSRTSGPLQLTLAGSFTKLLGETGAEHLRNSNGARDYSIWTGNIQFRLPLGGRRLQLGADFMHNAQDYRRDDPDPFTAAHFDQKDAFALSVTWGQLESRHDWLISYTWARIETLAVNASWAQDDSVRWGEGTQIDGSDQKGHEFRGGYTILPGFFVLARLYLFQAITSVQDGKRFRVDVNYAF